MYIKPMSPKNLLNKYTLLRVFLERFQSKTIGGISKVIVFGSVATGTASAHSDIDVIVLTTSEETSVKETVRKIAYEAMEEDGFNRLISLHFMEEGRFAMLLNSGYSFEKEIESEGVPLWQAA